METLPMTYQAFRKLIKLVLIQITIFALLLQPVYALDCDIPTDDDPSPVQILCPIVKALNVIILIGGAVFVIILFLTAYKFAMSQGDPKAMQGARDTGIYAVIGFLIVISVFTILKMMQVMLGLDTGILNPMANLETYIKILASKACICIDGSYTDPSPVCTLLFPCK